MQKMGNMINDWFNYFIWFLNNMILEQYEIDMTKNNLTFMSRVNDNLKGEDIDLYLGTLSGYDSYEKVYFHHWAYFLDKFAK